MRTVRIVLLGLVMALALAGPITAQAATTGPVWGAEVDLLKCELPEQFSYGGTFSRTFSWGIPSAGYQLVDVQLQGWKFNFASSDHHITNIGIRITDVSYIPGLDHSVYVTVEGGYHDKNLDDDYYWQVWLTILGFR